MTMSRPSLQAAGTPQLLIRGIAHSGLSVKNICE